MWAEVCSNPKSADTGAAPTRAQTPRRTKDADNGADAEAGGHRRCAAQTPRRADTGAAPTRAQTPRRTKDADNGASAGTGAAPTLALRRFSTCRADLLSVLLSRAGWRSFTANTSTDRCSCRATSAPTLDTQTGGRCSKQRPNITSNPPPRHRKQKHKTQKQLSPTRTGKRRYTLPLPPTPHLPN